MKRILLCALTGFSLAVNAGPIIPDTSPRQAALAKIVAAYKTASPQDQAAVQQALAIEIKQPQDYLDLIRAVKANGGKVPADMIAIVNQSQDTDPNLQLASDGYESESLSCKLAGYAGGAGLIIVPPLVCLGVACSAAVTGLTMCGWISISSILAALFG